MSNQRNGGLFSCTNMCWIAGALFALAAGLILARLYGMSNILSIIIALVLMVVIAWLLQRAFCTGMPEGHHTDAAPAEEEIRVAPEHLAEIDLIEDESLATKPDLTTLVHRMRPDESEAAAADAGESDVAQEPPAKAEATPAKKPEPQAAEEKKPAAKSAERRPVAPDGKPELLKAPRGGKGDDLKMIKGIGPKLEKLLNELGVWHFDQIASWRKKEVEWVDSHLEGFKGRIERDEWVKQARTLAGGGSTEFANRVKKGKVYKE